MKQSKSYLEYLYGKGKREFNDLDGDEQRAIAGYLLSEAPRSEQADAIANMDTINEVADAIGQYMTTCETDARSQCMGDLMKGVADFYKKTIDRLFEEFGPEFCKAEYEEVDIYNRLNFMPLGKLSDLNQPL